MRLWSLHPSYLDAKGLVAVWREGLLAQKVLLGETNGYKHHPQLRRFKNTRNPAGAVASYLRDIVNEADRRGYRFDSSKIINEEIDGLIPVTTGQLDYEFLHLLEKLKKRDVERHGQLIGMLEIKIHPIFNRIIGDLEDWEIVTYR